MKVNGSCLCNSVKFSFEAKAKHFDACHCSMCRKWGGGPAMMVDASGNVKFENEEGITVYSSSQWAERGFCKKCGTHLFYRLKGKDFINFNLGTIENNQEFEFTTQIFTDAKPGNYEFANKTKMMTEKDVLEAFGAS